MAFSKAEKELLLDARKMGKMACVLPPESGYPQPHMGFRTMLWTPSVKKWVTVFLGAEAVMDALVNQYNTQARQLTHRK